MPFFNLVVSIWQHYTVLKDTVGIGFEKSVFTYSDGTCNLFASKEEITEICNRIMTLARTDQASFRRWYEQAKLYNKESDDLIDQYKQEYKQEAIHFTVQSYKQVYENFLNNFGLCTIFPYWVLFSIDQAIERGENKRRYSDILDIYQELKGETRYPQLAEAVINKYLHTVAMELGIDDVLAACIHPDELENILAGKEKINPNELRRRMNWCAIKRGEKPYKVKYIYDKGGYPDLILNIANENISELRGNVAYKGLVRGKVNIIDTISDLRKFNEGDILVSIHTNPSIMPAIVKCSGIVTDEGGIMCHAAIVSRELKKPCIIGTKIATKVLKDGDLVEVDANKGIVKILKKAER